MFSLCTRIQYLIIIQIKMLHFVYNNITVILKYFNYYFAIPFDFKSVLCTPLISEK